MSKQTMQHTLIPKHKKISEKEKTALLDQYKITVNELPSITKTDVALAGIEVEVGDVIRIDRNSPTAGQTVFYRGVVDE
ncbi:MAG: DNA-directed RNA polymerase subunit H [Candidatus Woesearchaeota archaeon]